MKFSGLAQDKVFSQSAGATSMTVLGEFEMVDELAYMDIGELTTFITDKGRGHFPDPRTVAKSVQSAAKISYNLPLPLNNSINQVISVSIANIRAMKEPVKSFDNTIAKQLELIPNSKCLLSIKGVGQVYAAGIISEIGDINRFDSHASLAKYAGIAWSEYKSSNFSGEITNLIKSGNRYLRYYLLEAADSIRKCDSEFRRFYNLKFN